MRHKGYKIAAGLLFMLTAAFHAGPAPYCRLARSARVFQENFRSLENARTNLGPLERLVFSVMLANGGERKAAPGAPARRAS